MYIVDNMGYYNYGYSRTSHTGEYSHSHIMNMYYYMHNTNNYICCKTARVPVDYTGCTIGKYSGSNPTGKANTHSYSHLHWLLAHKVYSISDCSAVAHIYSYSSLAGSQAHSLHRLTNLMTIHTHKLYSRVYHSTMWVILLPSRPENH